MSGERSKRWYGSDSRVGSVVGTLAAAVLLSCGLLCMSTNRAAAPGCTASGLSSALATVASGTAGWLAGEPSRGRSRRQQRRRKRDPHLFRGSHRPVAAAAGHRQSAAHPAHFLPAAGFGRGCGPAVRRDERL